tara:strand:- start:779 stop:1039 length:261 start_codon:yes stop_codon:yes gene_type:complete
MARISSSFKRKGRPWDGPATWPGLLANPHGGVIGILSFDLFALDHGGDEDQGKAEAERYDDEGHRGLLLLVATVANTIIGLSLGIL